jgi:hypothetical protein
MSRGGQYRRAGRNNEYRYMILRTPKCKESVEQGGTQSVRIAFCRIRTVGTTDDHYHCRKYVVSHKNQACFSFCNINQNKKGGKKYNVTNNNMGCGSRAWCALMRRNMTYRRRYWFSTVRFFAVDTFYVSVRTELTYPLFYLY